MLCDRIFLSHHISVDLRLRVSALEFRCCSKFHSWLLLVQSFEFHRKIKGLPYSSDSNEISKFEEFDHKMLKFPPFVNFSRTEIALFWHSEKIII